MATVATHDCINAMLGAELLAPPQGIPIHGDREVRASLDILRDLYNYNHWLFNRVRPFIRGRVCEVGCGIGTTTQFLLGCESVTCVEPSFASFVEARSRFQPHANVKVVHCPIETCPSGDVPAGAFDTVMCLNVLEHIEDDVDALGRMARLCSPGGRVILLVPAHMSAYGTLDERFGHFRRYNRRTLGRACAAAGLRIGHGFYMNCAGYFGWILQGRILKRTQITPESGRLFNRLVPLLDVMERLIPPFFGQSLVMVGTVDGGSSSRGGR
jgi:SAM-dependent methyltransferase